MPSIASLRRTWRQILETRIERGGVEEAVVRGGEPSTISVVEVLSALALATDVATGAAFEKSLQTCLIADAFAGQLGFGTADRRAIFQAALLRGIGCTSHAPENAELFGDDIAFQSAFHVLDPGSPEVFKAQLADFGSWVSADRRPAMTRLLIERGPALGPQGARTVCEVSRALGTGLSLDPVAIAALDEVYERWDGTGFPEGIAGELISPHARIVHVAEQAVLAYSRGGPAAAVAEVRRRGGGQLDPDLAAQFAVVGVDLLRTVEGRDLVAAVVDTEPGPPSRVPFGDLDRLCVTFAMVADLKGRFLLGHSTHVADLAVAAASLLDIADVGTVRAAALTQDIGRVAVSSEIWDRPGSLGVADWERVRLHSYWTARILRRCPATEALARDAGAHHERCDGTGYPHGSNRTELSITAKVLGAADVMAALTEDRPHRPAYSRTAAAGIVRAEVDSGRLDPDAAAAVLEAAGLPKPRRNYPCDLTEREVHVLRLVARGQTNRQIAAALNISDRTVGHHLAHIYDKTGLRTRAGVAVVAMEHGLLRD